MKGTLKFLHGLMGIATVVFLTVAFVAFLVRGSLEIWKIILGT
jgi:hypothetical protein